MPISINNYNIKGVSDICSTIATRTAPHCTFMRDLLAPFENDDQKIPQLSTLCRSVIVSLPPHHLKRLTHDAQEQILGALDTLEKIAHYSAHCDRHLVNAHLAQRIHRATTETSCCVRCVEVANRVLEQSHRNMLLLFVEAFFKSYHVHIMTTPTHDIHQLLQQNLPAAERSKIYSLCYDKNIKNSIDRCSKSIKYLSKKNFELIYWNRRIIPSFLILASNVFLSRNAVSDLITYAGSCCTMFAAVDMKATIRGQKQKRDDEVFSLTLERKTLRNRLMNTWHTTMSNMFCKTILKYRISLALQRKMYKAENSVYTQRLCPFPYIAHSIHQLPSQTSSKL